MNNRKLVLENGLVFEGVGFGSANEQVAELIFNTSVVGYQEILSDPANCNKIICMSYPLIGNYGMADDDFESKHINVSGLIVREYNDSPSNFRFTSTLSEVMEENNVSGISGIDTREIVRLVRDCGSMKALICDIDKDLKECFELLNAYQEEDDLAKIVSCKKVWYSRTPNPMFNVVVIDCGVKSNLIKKLNSAGCNVVVVPYNTSIEAILSFKPNGLFISNGPGNPEVYENIIKIVDQIKGKIPVLGVGLGHLIIGLAYGAKVLKMKNGHHGSNYPVRNVDNGKVEITTQNHLYCLDRESLNNTLLEVSHENVITLEVEGIIDRKNKVIGLQYEPSTPINENSENAIVSFVKMFKKVGGRKNA
jgi:carbamoyl-phosphate synthase small subunit